MKQYQYILVRSRKEHSLGIVKPKELKYNDDLEVVRRYNTEHKAYKELIALYKLDNYDMFREVKEL